MASDNDGAITSNGVGGETGADVVTLSGNVGGVACGTYKWWQRGWSSTRG